MMAAHRLHPADRLRAIRRRVVRLLPGAPETVRYRNDAAGRMAALTRPAGLRQTPRSTGGRRPWRTRGCAERPEMRSRRIARARWSPLHLPSS